jgi:hypothetical protein
MDTSSHVWRLILDQSCRALICPLASEDVSFITDVERFVECGSGLFARSTRVPRPSRAAAQQKAEAESFSQPEFRRVI